MVWYARMWVLRQDFDNCQVQMVAEHISALGVVPGKAAIFSSYAHRAMQGSFGVQFCCVIWHQKMSVGQDDASLMHCNARCPTAMNTNHNNAACVYNALHG